MKRITMMIAAALLAAGSARAVEESGWSFEITPYAWLAGLEGNLTVGGREVDFDKSFSDLFDATEVRSIQAFLLEQARIASTKSATH